MTEWAAVEGYLVDTVVHPDEALTAAVQATAAAGMPAIEVTPTQGKLLMLLATIQGARRVRPGSIIILDNAVRGGTVLETDGDEAVQGTRGALELLGRHPRLEATVIQTVGTKDWDGFALAVVTGAAA